MSNPLLVGGTLRSCGHLSPFDDYRPKFGKTFNSPGPTCLIRFFSGPPERPMHKLGRFFLIVSFLLVPILLLFPSAGYHGQCRGRRRGQEAIVNPCPYHPSETIGSC